VTRRCCQFLLALCIASSSAFADDHQHSLIVVRSAPVIQRLAVRVIHPTDVVVAASGDTLVADKVGKMVFRVDAVDETSILGKELDGLVRVADSRSFGVHALLRDDGKGQIVRLLKTGFREDVCELSFEPAGLGVDAIGNIWTANPKTGDVILLDSTGTQQKAIRLQGIPTDIAVDGLGAVVLLRSGEIVSVSADGSWLRVGYVPAAASRLKLTPDHSVVALVTDGDGQSMLVRPTTNRESVDRFAMVTRGTSAFAFDRLGNLTLANPELPAITRVTSHFTVPCPHCGQQVPMLFSTHAPALKTPTRRSF
jgi:hypothetical protein